MKAETKKWLESAQYDLESARNMFSTEQAIKDYSKEIAFGYLQSTEEVVAWLKAQPGIKE